MQGFKLLVAALGLALCACSQGDIGPSVSAMAPAEGVHSDEAAPAADDGGPPCERGHVNACLERCEAGNAESCYLAAVSVYRLAPKDPGYAAQRAAEMPLLERACQGQVPEACHAIGSNYANEAGGMYRPDEAMQTWRDACHDLEFGDSCLSLSRVYRSGTHGRAKAPALSRSMLERGCRFGSRAACESLAQAYFVGDEKMNIRRDATRGVEVYDRACQAGNVLACKALSHRYTTGKDVKKDLVAAQRYRDAACGLTPRDISCSGE